jgi:hypothetical protein
LTGLIQGPDRYVIERTREGEVLRCPWHGWEFDLTNGHSIYNPHRVRARSYDVMVEPDNGSDADAGEELAAADTGESASAATPIDGGLVRRTIAEDEDDPSIETFAVEVEREVVVLYLGRSKPARRADTMSSSPTA